MNDKFRVWDKKDKYIANVLKIDFVEKEVYVDQSFDWIKFEDVILMQCTGLKDKNDKLIYEGDIIKWSHDETKTNDEIIFEEGCFKYKKINGWLLENINDCDYKECEIIGNIYQQNKNLLDK